MKAIIFMSGLLFAVISPSFAIAGLLEDGFLPGSSIAIPKPIAVKMEEYGRRIPGAYASFKNGVKISNFEDATNAEKEGETICKVITHFNPDTLKAGNYYNLYNARSFMLLIEGHKPVSNEDYLYFKCFRSSKAMNNPNNFLYWEVEYDLSMLKKAFGNNLIFNLKKSEKFQIDGVEFETGLKHGEAYNREYCGYALYKFENNYYINMTGGNQLSCNVRLEKKWVEKGRLAFSGKQIEIKMHPSIGDTFCEAHFEHLNAKLTKKVSLIRRSWVTGKVEYDFPCDLK